MSIESKLEWLRFDPYEQIRMGNDEPVMKLTATLKNGEATEIVLTSRSADKSMMIKENYRLFADRWQPVAWENVESIN